MPLILSISGKNIGKWRIGALERARALSLPTKGWTAKERRTGDQTSRSVESRKRCEELFELWKVLALTIERHLYPLGVLDAHGNNAEGFRWPHTSVFNHKIHHALNLSRGALLLRSVARNVRDHLVPNNFRKTTTWKGDQPTAVELVV